MPTCRFAELQHVSVVRVVARGFSLHRKILLWSPIGYGAACVWLRAPACDRRACDDALTTANHDHRDPCRLSNRRADRPQKHAGKSAAPSTTNHYQLSAFRLIKQPLGRLVADKQSLDMHIGILFLPTGETFGQDLVPLTLALAPIHPENGNTPTSLHT